MKVILQRDVARLGKRHSIVVVPDGYALNKLLPQGLAVPATPEALKRITTATKEAASHAASAESALMDTLEVLKKAGGVMVKASSNVQGHLFRAIQNEEISAAAKSLGHTVPADLISSAAPIKSTGAHEVTVIVGKNKQPLTVVVEAA